ncbi:hypothetical protein LJR161_004509 [Variovorax paradoxus]|uniref:Lipoprotein n=1 Tax=Variovorax paradoxus TaxID=34073 RepID=A0AAW8EJV6_VARPD|nr:hypothetical protein [Variovorax paradoxus]MDP9973170.1 hypothetical protein [Variovorax paradoxus]
MRRNLGWCVLLLCSVMIAGCGGGSGNGSGVSSQDDVGAKSSAAEPSVLIARADLATPADEQAGSNAKELNSIIRPLAKSPFWLARNGQFHVYAGNGSRQRLDINFDTKSYTVTDNLRQTTSGTFSEDALEPGTFVFASSRITSAVNTARFRVTADAIVGAFPFEKPWSNPVSYQVVPFVAARSFVTDRSQLDGNYNRLGISHNSNGISDSQILAMRIAGGGTTLEMCFDNAIYRIESCPAVSKRTYAIAPSPDSAWTAINVAAPGDLLQFRMARIGGENVWLSGGYTNAAPDVHVFRVGLPDSANWPRIRYVGASTEGSWGTNVFDATTSLRSAITPEGVSGDLNLPFASIGGPQGIRILNVAGPKKYYAIQNGVLSIIVGTRNPETQGYIQVNLLKDQLDARSGRYTVFASNGTEQTLDVDFETQRYSMSAPGGDTVTGTFSEDANDRGTYIFASERIATITNTARFRTTTDAVVGAFPFAVFKSDPVVHVAQPFIAARSFVTDRSQLAGLFDVLITSKTATPDVPLQVAAEWQLRINASGTIATQCSSGASSSCQQPGTPPLSFDFSISPGASPGIWLLGNNEDPIFAVRIARIGGRRVLLQATEMWVPISGPPYAAPASMLLTGLAQSPPGSSDANWPTLNMHSASTASSFGTAITDTTSYATHYFLPDGTSTDLTLALQPVAGNPQMRQGLDSNGNQYFLVQNGAILFMAPGRPAVPYLHIGLAD